MIITNVTDIPENQLSNNMLQSLIEFRQRQHESLPSVDSLENPYIENNDRTVSLTDLNSYKKRLCNTNQLINKMRANKNYHASQISSMQRKYSNIQNRIKKNKTTDKLLYKKYQNTLPNYLKSPYKKMNTNNLSSFDNEIYQQYENLYKEYQNSPNFTPNKLLKYRIGVQSLIKRNENQLNKTERNIRSSLQVINNLNKQIDKLENTKKTYLRIIKDLKNKQNSKRKLEKKVDSNIKKRVLNNLADAVKQSAKRRKIQHNVQSMTEQRKKQRFDQLWSMFGQK